MSQGAEISQPSASMHLPAHCDDWMEDMGCDEGGDEGVRGELEFRSHGGAIKEKCTQSIYWEILFSKRVLMMFFSLLSKR